MGRRSKLSDRQWAEVGRRLLNGEKPRLLAAEFGVSETTIRERFSEVNGKIKDVANQLLSVETSLQQLPISAQISAVTLAAQLRSISTHLSSAANNGAMVAHRLSGIALQQVEQVDDAQPERSLDALSRINSLTRLVNQSSELGMNLLSANRERVRAGELESDPVMPVRVTVTVQDASEPEPNTQLSAG
jgi:hypothetical protein